MPEVPPNERPPSPEESEEAEITPPPWVRTPSKGEPEPPDPNTSPGLDESRDPTAIRDGIQPAWPPEGDRAPNSGPWQSHPATGPGGGGADSGAPDALAPGLPPELAGLPGVPGQGEAGSAVTGAPAAKRPLSQSLGRGFREIAETIILALLIFLAVRAVVQNFQVEGSSMEPTLESTQYLLVNKAQYWEINLETLSKFIPFLDPGDDPTRFIFGGPGRGDVVVFKAPNSAPGQPERDFIKRVIAVPGEVVEVHDCAVFIDGQPLDEPYINQKPNYTFGPETVPADHYFVLGDNRNNSRDSHVSDIGMVPKESIIGKAWLIYWPFSAFGLVDNTSVEPGAGAESSTEKDDVAATATCP